MVGLVLFYLKFALKVTHLFEKRRLRPISTYNVSNVRASENVQLSRIGSRPRAFQRAIDEVHTLPLTRPKGGSKSEIVEESLLQSFFCVKTSNRNVVLEPFPYPTVCRC